MRQRRGWNIFSAIVEQRSPAVVHRKWTRRRHVQQQVSPHRVLMSVIVLLVSLALRGLLVDGSLGLILPSKGKPASSVSVEQEI